RRQQPQLGDRAQGVPGRAYARGAAGWRDRAVRAPRLFLPGSRLDAWAARLQPHTRPQGHLGQAPGAGPPAVTTCSWHLVPESLVTSAAGAHDLPSRSSPGNKNVPVGPGAATDAPQRISLGLRRAGVV